MTILKTIGVFGGSGFVGRSICKKGVQLGYNVIGFSRSGKPTGIQGAWVDKVNWHKADIFDPSTYENQLKDIDVVVHSMGLLFENQAYKKTINTNFNFFNDIQNLARVMRGANPMTKGQHDSYEAIQRDSAVILADAFLEARKEKMKPKPTFVYISADQKMPIVPEAYIDTKREAEFELSCKPGLRSISLRPGFMYDSELQLLNARALLKTLLSLGYGVKNAVLGDNVSYINNLIRPPVSVQQLSLTLYDKVEKEEFDGTVLLEEIREY